MPRTTAEILADLDRRLDEIRGELIRIRSGVGADPEVLPTAEEVRAALGIPLAAFARRHGLHYGSLRVLLCEYGGSSVAGIRSESRRKMIRAIMASVRGTPTDEEYPV